MSLVTCSVRIKSGRQSQENGSLHVLHRLPPDLHPPALSAADGLCVHFRPCAGTVRPSGSPGEQYDWFR